MIKATISNNHVEIESYTLRYDSLVGVYIAGEGFGLQLVDETLREKSAELCHQIASKLRELDLLVNGSSTAE
jgi:hypothetical protein